MEHKCPVCFYKHNKLNLNVNNFNIWECLSCHLNYVYPIPRKEELNKFYSSFDYHDSENAEKVVREDSIRSLRRIKKYLTKKENTLLDIGCGRGYFLDEARKLGIKKTLGIDFSSNMAQHAKTKYGLKVEHTDILNFSSNTKYNIIVLNQVIEHFSNPKDVIDKCRKMLDHNGIFYIATPNIISLSARVHNDKFDYLIPPEHLVYFSPHSIKVLLNRCGFEVTYVGTWGYKQEFAGIIKRIIYGTTKKPDVVAMSQSHQKNLLTKNSIVKKIKYLLFDQIFCGLFYRVLFYVNLGSILEVVAIKRE